MPRRPRGARPGRARMRRRPPGRRPPTVARRFFDSESTEHRTLPARDVDAIYEGRRRHGVCSPRARDLESRCCLGFAQESSAGEIGVASEPVRPRLVRAASPTPVSAPQPRRPDPPQGYRWTTVRSQDRRPKSIPWPTRSPSSRCEVEHDLSTQSELERALAQAGRRRHVLVDLFALRFHGFDSVGGAAQRAPEASEARRPPRARDPERRSSDRANRDPRQDPRHRHDARDA